MSTASKGDRVKVHYTGYLEDGTVFDTSRSEDREPFEFIVGEGAVISGFESAVEGMAVGQTKSVEVPPEDAYQARNDDLVFEVERGQFPEDIQLEVGMLLKVSTTDEQVPETDVTVVEVREDAIVLDGNHPLAGRTLKFDLELLEVMAEG